MSNREHLRRRLIFLLTAAAVVPLDQLTKLWVTNLWKSGVIPLGTGFFRITYVTNTGAAFGIFQNSIQVLAVVSAVGALVALYIGLFISPRSSFFARASSLIALGLVLGGTVGNLIDRAFIGYVTDFIKVGAWPDFNMADSSEVVGGILLAFNLIRSASTEQGGGETSPSGGK